MRRRDVTGRNKGNELKRSNLLLKKARLTFVTNFGDVVTSHANYVDEMMLQKASLHYLEGIALLTRRE